MIGICQGAEQAVFWNHQNPDMRTWQRSCIMQRVSETVMADHVHLLLRWRPDASVSDLLRIIKSGSSGWMHKSVDGMSDFRWQDGFGAFSVSLSQSDKLRGYIANQECHHRETDFKDEFRALLKAHGIDFDEEYIWR